MAEAFITSRLQGRRILIVKNDYLQAQKLVELMQNQGAEVAGPAASVEKAIGVLLKDPLPNMLVLDVRLGREKVFPLAESLKTIGIPFVFASSSRSWSLPEACEGALHCKKLGQNNGEAVDLVAERRVSGRFRLQGFVGLTPEPCNIPPLDEASSPPS